MSTDKKESEQTTMNLLSSEDVTYLKARNIDLDLALVIELADSNRRQYTSCEKTADVAILSTSLKLLV